MRSKSKTVLAVLVAALAVTATTASAASAFTEYVGREGVGTKVTQTQSGSIVIVFNPGFTMTCTSVTGSGVVTSTSLLTMTSAFGGCTVSGLPVKNVDSCHYTYGINGKLGVEGTNCGKFEIAALGCVITINGGQSGLSTLTYANLGGSFESEATLSVGGVHFSTTTGQHCFMEHESISGNVSYSGHTRLLGVKEH
jgi:hypothetical protein